MYFMNLYENELAHYGVKGIERGAKRSKSLFKRTIRKSCLPYFFSFFAQNGVNYFSFSSQLRKAIPI